MDYSTEPLVLYVQALFVNLLSIHSYVFGSDNTESHLATPDFYHRDVDIATDDDLFADVPC